MSSSSPEEGSSTSYLAIDSPKETSVSQFRTTGVEGKSTLLFDFPIVIRESERVGRYQVSRRPLKEGELIFRTTAYAHAVLPSYRRKICAHCLVSVPHLVTPPLSSEEGLQEEGDEETEEKGEEEEEEEEEMIKKGKESCSQPIFVCQTCQQCFYCSLSCWQKDQQKGHGLVAYCEAVRKLSKSKFGGHIVSVLLLALAIHMRRVCEEGGEEEAKEEKRREHQTEETIEGVTIPTISFSDVDRLVSHESKLEKEDLVDLRKGLKLIQQCLKPSSLGGGVENKGREEEGSSADQQQRNFKRQTDLFKLFSDEAAILKLVSQIESNGFGVWHPSTPGVLFGRAIFPLASFFNHSCEPNCSAKEEGSTLSIYTKKPIAEGEEVCISYIDENKPRSARQYQLSQEYHFNCLCSRCVREAAPGGGGTASKITYRSASNKGNAKNSHKKKTTNGAKR